MLSIEETLNFMYYSDYADYAITCSVTEVHVAQTVRPKMIFYGVLNSEHFWKNRSLRKNVANILVKEVWKCIFYVMPCKKKFG